MRSHGLDMALLNSLEDLEFSFEEKDFASSARCCRFGSSFQETSLCVFFFPIMAKRQSKYLKLAPNGNI